VEHGRGAEVVFVGGGDRERADLLEPVLGGGLEVRIYGSYWPRGTAAARACLGQAGVETLRRETKAAKVNLCLVRRSNRDEHVMRSYEAAAAGGCVLAEDTEDHRRIYGDGARYFRSGEELAREARELVESEGLRRELAAAAEARVTAGGNSYDDRLEEMLRMLGRRSRGNGQ
jgi:spore maturation protein CgeB